jgi:hypothetical protein
MNSENYLGYRINCPAKLILFDRNGFTFETKINPDQEIIPVSGITLTSVDLAG